MQFFLLRDRPSASSDTTIPGRVIKLCVCASVSAVFFASVSTLLAQSDVGASAPWQTYSNAQSQGRTEYRTPKYRTVSETVGQTTADPVMYEGAGPVYEEGAFGEACRTCDDGCCYPNMGLCPDPFRGRFWFSGEYLMWWDKSNRLPPLATTSIAGTARNQAGILGRAGTSTIIGGGNADLGIRSGARLTLGCWMSPCQDEAFEATYLFFGSDKLNLRQTSDDYSILARPFYNAQSFLQDAVVIAYPNQQTGWINAAVSNELASLSLSYRNVFMRDECRQLSIIAGYRYSRFNENLAVDSSTTYSGQVGVIPVGTVIDTADWFQAKNEFHGGELGVSAKSRYNRWSFEFLAKLGLGSTRSRLRVAGATTVAVPGLAPVSYDDGMLALATNSGITQKSGFTAIPEFGLNVGYALTPRMKATFGYTFLYWSRVVRPADQIDMSLNPTQFPPGALVGYPAPEGNFITTDYWAQGFNFGLDYRY